MLKDGFEKTIASPNQVFFKALELSARSDRASVTDSALVS